MFEKTPFKELKTIDRTTSNCSWLIVFIDESHKSLILQLITKSSTVRTISTVFFLIFLCAVQVGVLQAQDEVPTLCDSIPYNPDWDCDGLIGVFDFLPFASLFGNDFLAEVDSLIFPEDLDPDPTNELQWLAIDGDTLRLLMPDSTVYNSVYIGGADGADGADGTNGLSAYELWLEAGNAGTAEDFLSSLIGEQGADGADGATGADGAPGSDGSDGLSAYEIWGNAGNEGSESDFLASLVGADGADGATGADGAPGADGSDGLSAYEIWINAGNEGSESDFLASLVGADGADGPAGVPGEQGETGADGAPGLSAYEVWLGLGNEGTEEDFIAYLSGGQAFSPSSHGVHDSETDGNIFVVSQNIGTLCIELWGTSGGSGGAICGQTLGASSCNLCDGTGGAGGSSLKVISMVYNLAQGDTLELVGGTAGTDSDELLTCNPGITGWTDWDCGPASSGGDGGTTQLLLNGQVIIEITGGMGGTGACIGCQGDGCFNGDPGAPATLTNMANWICAMDEEAVTESTDSRVILRY